MYSLRRLMSDELSLQALGTFANRNIRCQTCIEMLQPLRYSMVGLRTRLHATGGQPATLCWSQRLATAAFPAANGEPCEDDTSWGHSNEDTQTFQLENGLHFFEHLQTINIRQLQLDSNIFFNSSVISDLVPWSCVFGEIGTDSGSIGWVQTISSSTISTSICSFCSSSSTRAAFIVV